MVVCTKEIKVASAESEAVEKKPRSHGGKVLRKNTHDSNTSHYQHGSIIWRFVISSVYGITPSRYFISAPSGFAAINSFQSKRPIRHMNVSWPSAQGLHQKLNNFTSFLCLDFSYLKARNQSSESIRQVPADVGAIGSWPPSQQN